MASHLKTLLELSQRAAVLKSVPCPLVQSVRFRKPRWLPKAASKEFYVRTPTPIIPEEHEELEERYKVYRASMRGMRLYLKEHLAKMEVKTVETQASDKIADFEWMTQEAKRWNENIALSRTKRQEEEERLERERIEELVRKESDLRLEKTIEAEKTLEANKKAAENFITEDHLDEEIEKMLDSRSDYNFAITKSGAVIPGEHPERKPSQDSVASS